MRNGWGVTTVNGLLDPGDHICSGSCLELVVQTIEALLAVVALLYLEYQKQYSEYSWH